MYYMESKHAVPYMSCMETGSKELFQHIPAEANVPIAVDPDHSMMHMGKPAAGTTPDPWPPTPDPSDPLHLMKHCNHNMNLPLSYSDDQDDRSVLDANQAAQTLDQGEFKVYQDFWVITTAVVF